MEVGVLVPLQVVLRSESGDEDTGRGGLLDGDPHWQEEPEHTHSSPDAEQPSVTNEP